MAVSSNTLFHVTKSFGDLKSILNEGFRVHYCRETFSMNWIEEKITSPDSEANQNVFVPMVSFSDIPLSQIKNHFDKYESKFAIGLTKEWGIAKGLNPILYTVENSSLTKDIITFMLENFKNFSPEFGQKNGNELYRMFRYILSYTKNYKGVIKQGKLDSENLAYNEKEWRYIPTDKELIKIGITKDLLDLLDTIDNDATTDVFNLDKATYQKDRIKDIKLTFNPEEIKYIIIEQQSDAKKLIEFLIERFGSKSDRLIASIFTMKQIFEDF